MNDYVGCVCSVCNKPFAAGDDIVVCPECGTPYHRACYQAAGGCVHEAQHAEGYAWQPQQHAQQAGGPQGQPAARVPRLRRAKPPRGAVLRKLRHAPFGPRGPAGPRRGLGPGRGKPLCAGGRARAGLWAARGRRTARLGRGGTACRQL